MRSVRWTPVALLLAALLPAVAAAQPNRHFEDAWFWGLKAGTVTFSTIASDRRAAPVLGAEWLITRSRGGLYVAVEQAWFEGDSRIFGAQGRSYPVELRNSRRLTFAAMAFPTQYRGFRPYAGAGFAINFINDAVPGVGFDTLPDYEQYRVLRDIDDQKSAAGLIGIAGIQAQYWRGTVFGQFTIMPRREDFLFNSGAMYTLEGGFRYNIGSSIERLTGRGR